MHEVADSVLEGKKLAEDASSRSLQFIFPPFGRRIAALTISQRRTQLPTVDSAICRIVVGCDIYLRGDVVVESGDD